MLLKKDLLSQSPLRKAYALEEEATAMLQRYDHNESLGMWSYGRSETQYEVSEFYQALCKTFEKSAVEFEKLGDLQNAWRVRSLATKAVRFTHEHPMYEMRPAIKAKKEQNLNPHTGTKMSHLGTPSIKDGVVTFDKRLLEEAPIRTEGGTGEIIIPPTPTLSVSFDVNVPVRKALQKRIEAIDAHPETFFEELPIGFCETITIKTVPHFYRQLESTGVYSRSKGFNGGQDDTATEIEFHGIGKIIVGNNPQWGCHYNHITIECPEVVGVDNGKNLKKMEQILTLLGLPLSLTQRTSQDMERSKLTALFHVYYPAESAKLEKTEDYYTMPLPDLKRRIFEIIPRTAHKTFLERLAKMQPRESLPGQIFWTAPDLLEDLTKNGVWYLMTGMGGVIDDDDAFTRGMTGGVKFLLSQGFLPTTEKYRAGYSSSAGTSPIADLQHGGGNGVFTRAINEKLTKDYRSTDPYAFNGWINQIPFTGGVQAILDPKLLIDTNTLFYNEDTYGVDNPESLRYKKYETRKDPAQFAKELGPDNSDNEVVLRGTIPPQAVLGLVVKTPRRKAELIDYLKKEGLAKLQGDKYIINGKEVDKFVHVGERFTKEMGA